MDVVTYALLSGKVSGVESMVTSLAEGFAYKGSKSSVSALPDDAAAGDLYTVGGKKYVWDGTNWVQVIDYELDDDLDTAGAAADAKAVGDALATKVPTTRTVNSKALSSDITLAAGDIGYDGTAEYSSSTVGAEVTGLKTAIMQTNANVLNDDIRNALLGCFQNVTWSSPDGLIYYDALQDALFNNSFTVTNTLTNCTTSNNATKVSSGGSYEATITGINNYAIESATVSITMGGVDITQTAYSDGVINIASVTGNLSITVSLSVQMFDYIKQTGVVRDENAIITDVAMSSDYILETAFYYTSSTYGGNVPIFGTRASQYGAKQIAIFVKPTTTDMGYWFGGTDSATSITGVSNNTLNTLVISPVGTSVTYPNNATIKVNNTEYNSGSTSTGDTWANWFTFFAYGYSATNNAVADNIGLRFYETKIKNSGGTLLHDFVPANNGTYNGFYDRVTKTFYCNEENNSLYECGND